LIKSRQKSLEQQDFNLENIVNLKIFSFIQYLKRTKLNGFSKWCIINQIVKEEHPLGLSLLEINKIKDDNKNLSQKG
jgi:hypothetical protein